MCNRQCRVVNDMSRMRWFDGQEGVLNGHSIGYGATQPLRSQWPRYSVPVSREESSPLGADAQLWSGCGRKVAGAAPWLVTNGVRETSGRPNSLGGQNQKRLGSSLCSEQSAWPEVMRLAVVLVAPRPRQTATTGPCYWSSSRRARNERTERTMSSSELGGSAQLQQ